MSEDRKSSRILNSILATIASVSDDKSSSGSESKADFRTTKDLIGFAANWAGKGKDEVVQMLCREIGVAIAAVVKEPLTQVLENRKLRITLELVPKHDAAPKHDAGKSTKSKKSKKPLQKTAAKT